MSNKININATANTMKVGHRTVTFSVYGAVQKGDCAGIPATNDEDVRNYAYYPFNGKTTTRQALGICAYYDNTFYQVEFKTPLALDKIEVCLAREDSVTSVSMYIDYTDGTTDTVNITPSGTSGFDYDWGAAQLKTVNPNSAKKTYRIRMKGVATVDRRCYWGLCYVTLYGDASYAVMAKSEAPINLLDKSTVSGFAVAGVEPEKTKRRVAFKVDDKWNKLTVTSGTAALTPLTTQDITADSILEEGNTAAEISSVTSCPPMVGKLVYPAVALYADESATVMPTFGLTVKAAIDTTVNVYTYTDYSQEYSLGRDDVNLVSLVAETETKGGGKVDITARIKTAGTWSEYQPLNNCQMKQASAVQLKAVYSVQSTDGSDSAAIKSVTVKYSTSGATVADATTDIVTVTKRFSYGLSYVHAYIKHKQLIDAKINAYCALRKRPAYRDMVQVGNGTGSLTTYKLADAGINQDTLKVYVDGKAINDYGYNTETSELTITADKDAVISASYEYGWELSTWKQMTQGETQVNDSGEYTTEYVYNVPAHDGAYTVTAVKYSLERPTGHVEEETIGTGTGKRQLIKLPHIARKETIVCNGSWSYDYDRQLLTIIAPEKEPIVISYDWIAETPEVHAVGAGWAD